MMLQLRSFSVFSRFLFFHSSVSFISYFSFFFNDTATTEIYTLSLHDALPICSASSRLRSWQPSSGSRRPTRSRKRSEEHTSELQSRQYLVCRLLLEKKKKKKNKIRKKKTKKSKHTIDNAQKKTKQYDTEIMKE